MKTNFKKEEECLRIGVLGCGLINQASHLINSVKGRNIHLQAICDVAADLREKMADIYRPDNVYSDFADMFKGILEAMDGCPVIIRLLDPPLHEFVPHDLAGQQVMAEEMGVSVEECEELMKLAEEKNVFIQIGHMKRYDEGLQFAKQFMEERMGEITTYKGWYCDSVGRYTLTDNLMPVIYSSDNMRKPAGNPKSILDRYYILGHGSHLLDMALFFMGDIEEISARYVNKGKIHSWLIDCNFANGAIGTLDLTVAIAQLWHEGCEIYGTGGTVFAKTPNPWELRSSTVECYDAADNIIRTPAAYDGNTYRRELEAFADTVLHGAPCTGAQAADGIKVMRAMIATYQSVQQGGIIIRPDSVTGSL